MAGYYEKDRELVGRLGLRAFGYEYGTWLDVGTVTLPLGDEEPWAEVRVELSQLPAMFYRFTITPIVEDVQAVTLETGSGGLVDFWPIVEAFAGGMVHATPNPAHAWSAA